MEIKYGHILKRLERQMPPLQLIAKKLGGVPNVQRLAKKQNCDEYDDEDGGYKDLDDRGFNKKFSHARWWWKKKVGRSY